MRLLDSDAMHMPGRCTELRLRPSAAEDPSGEMAAVIDALCDKIYADINNGVYVSGMSTTQVSAQLCSRRARVSAQGCTETPQRDGVFQGA